MLRTEYQLRFSCGTYSKSVCMVILRRNNNVSQSRNFKSLNIIAVTNC